MLLFKKAFFAGLQSGDITRDLSGAGRSRTFGPAAVIAAIRSACSRSTDRARHRRDDPRCRCARRRVRDARRTRRISRASSARLDDATPVYRVELHHGGDGDRVEIALERSAHARRHRRDPREARRASIATNRGRQKTLAIIGKHPQIAASQLAKKLGRETLPFKVDVRKLKKLGLTQSFEVGYEISPRGRAYLAAVPAEAR